MRESYFFADSEHLCEFVLHDIAEIQLARSDETFLPPENPVERAVWTLELLDSIRQLSSVDEFIRRMDSIPIGTTKRTRRQPLLSIINKGIKVDPGQVGNYFQRFANTGFFETVVIERPE